MIKQWMPLGCSVRARTEFVCAEGGLRFGREPKCVRGKMVIPWTIIYIQCWNDSGISG